MKTKLFPKFVAICYLLSAISEMAFAQGTAFTYQGRLNSGTNAANGSYDLRFTLFPTNSGGAQAAGPLTNSATGVSNGLFMVTLDFGSVFTGSNYWLEIGVRTNGNGAFTTLSPRQRITPAPYAITASNLSGTLLVGQLSGTVPLSQLPAAVITNNQSGVNLTGTFSGDGSGVTNVPFVGLNSSGLITWPGSFFLVSASNVGTQPASVAVGDVNGDGKPDLISANGRDNTLTVLTNKGNGTFVAASTNGVGSYPVSIIAVDVNGDGRVDLISANFWDSTLTVLTNNGVGGFVSNATLLVGNGPESVIAADVNGDNKLDLITANWGISGAGNTLSILTNNGSGRFGSNATLVVGSAPVGLVATDVNGDGRLDLISVNYYPDPTLTIMTNSSTGLFGFNATLNVDAYPFSIAAADVNGDNKMDLIAGILDKLVVLTNNGSGGFGTYAKPGVGTVVQGIVTADVNGDGRIDLITINFSDDTATVLINTGSGNFQRSDYFAGHGSGSIAAADVNGDGRVDLISANVDPINTLSVLLNIPNITGSFTGSGEGLTSLNASSLISGTLPDQRLSSNVALLDRSNQIFTGTNNFLQRVGLGTATPLAQLEIQGGADQFGGNDPKAIALAYRNGGYRHFIRTRHNSGTAGNGIDFFLNTSTNDAGSSAPGTGNTLALSVNATGVGVGTTSPVKALQVGDAGLFGSEGMIHLGSRSTNTAGSTGRNWDIGVPQTGDDVSGQGYSFVIRDADNLGANAPFIVRYDSHYVGVGTNAPQQALHVVGNILATGTVTGSSDRNAKEHFTPINPQEVLDKVSTLPISRWDYKADAGVTHLGPMAQDFYAAFNVGPDDQHISMVDADGVALAAIQGLNQKLNEKDYEIQSLKRQNDTLEKRLEKLEQMTKSNTERN